MALPAGDWNGVTAHDEHEVTADDLGRFHHRREDTRGRRPQASHRSHSRSRSRRGRRVQMEGYGAQPSPTIGQCINGGLGWLEVECKRCKTRASLPLDAIRRPRNTPIWKLEPALKCRSCRTPRYSPPVRMIKLTEQRELSPYVLVHPDEER